ncbi:collagen binding domain-containing protein [uncultured Jatrophihabitans sp.]|uniref:MSCRAMM family protein n=1 Tax=uncultured Jatrophihabitans sp. TaxID=1610747 RepID=UPI0035C9D428
MQLPAGGFPAAEWVSDSRSPVQLPSGSSTYLNASTPPGARYGTSQGQAYLNLRPYADNATSPSSTTFDFASTTPPAGWSFVLGDVDADQVHITARDADGQPVPGTDIDRWEQGAFNYAGGTDKPTWDRSSTTLVGNPTATDTNGASDWFTPDRGLSSLTFVFTQRSGFPVYQIWFAGESHDVTGTVTGTTRCTATEATLHLLGPDGTPLASTQPRADGSYTFPGYIAAPGYTVRVDAPAAPLDGCEVFGTAQRTVDLTGGDANVDFAVRDVRPQPITGTVTTTAGTALEGVTITLTDPAGVHSTATTDDTGRYLFDNNQPGTGYRVAITAPPGYTAQPPVSHTVDVAIGRPVPDQDFEVREQPTVSGTVTSATGALEDVPVTLTDTTGTVTHTVTDSAGHYRFVHVPAGKYAISVTAPPGYGAPEDREDVPVADADVTGQDFTVHRVGVIAGAVTDNGKPVPGARVRIDGPARTVYTSTDADGTYVVDDLEPATYTVTVRTSPTNTVVSPSTRTVTITAAGELRGGLNFALRHAAPPAPTSTPPGSASTPGTGASAPTGTTRALADTGTPVGPLTLSAACLLAAGVLISAAGTRHRFAVQRLTGSGAESDVADRRSRRTDPRRDG